MKTKAKRSFFDVDYFNNFTEKYFGYKMIETDKGKWYRGSLWVLTLFLIIFALLFLFYPCDNDTKPLIKNLEIGYFELIMENDSVIIKNLTIKYDSTKIDELIIGLENFYEKETANPFFTQEDADRLKGGIKN